MKKSISITCKTGELIEIAKLERFQGDLKEITPEAMDKLKASIVKYGFSFPIFVWQTKILDGHQRLEAAKQLIKDGYMLKGGKLPVVQIEADSDQEAAEKLLLINSRYAQITQAGFDAFVTDFDIDLSGFSGLLEIPEIDFEDITPDRIPDHSSDGGSESISMKLIFNPIIWSEKADDIKAAIDEQLKSMKVKYDMRIDE